MRGQSHRRITERFSSFSVHVLFTYLVKRERGKQAVGRTQNRSNIRRESSRRRDEWREATKKGSDSCKSGRGKDSDSVFTGVKRETAKLKGWSKVFLVVPLFAVSSEAHLSHSSGRHCRSWAAGKGMVEPPGSSGVPEGKEINRWEGKWPWEEWRVADWGRGGAEL